jgi:hypothetical protein
MHPAKEASRSVRSPTHTHIYKPAWWTSQKPDGATAWVLAVAFPCEHTATIHSIGVASSGRYIISASAGACMLYAHVCLSVCVCMLHASL